MPLSPATVEEQPAKVTTTSEDGSAFMRVGYNGDAEDGGTQRTSHSGEETVQGNPQGTNRMGKPAATGDGCDGKESFRAPTEKRGEMASEPSGVKLINDLMFDLD